jgi:WD40 repeat protein
MEPKPLSRVRSGVPRDLETIIHKSIEREPARRYQKAEDLTEDLRRFLEDRPVRARRASNLERVARWARRNPAVASLLGVVTMLMIGVSIASSLAAVQFRHARDDADAARVRAEKSGDSERWERYRANMIAAGGAMQLNNVSAAQAALDAAPEEHRNWEWKYFNHRLDTAQQVIHLGENLRALAVSHDGKFAAFQPADGPARLWDIESRKEIGPLGNTTPAQSFCFSSRNTMLAWMSGDRVVLWDIPAGRVRSVVVLPAKSHVEPALSPDGTRLLVGLQDRTARVWDTATGKQLHLLPGHEAPGPAAFFSSDGRRIASAGEQDRIVRIWDAETGELLEKLDDNNAPAGLVYFNRSDDRILSIEGYPSNALRLWDAAARKCLKVMRGHTNGAEFAAFSPDGSRIASGGLDRTVRLWDGRTGEALTSREGHRGALTAMTFSPDGSCVLSAAQDQTARLWDAKTGDPVSVLHGHTGAITSAYYTPDGTKIVTASVGDGTVRIWDAQSAQTHGSLRGHQSFVYDVAFHPDGERVASAAWDGTVRVWDATSGRQFPPIVYPYPPATEHKIVSSLAFHPAGKLVAAFGRDAALRFWDLATSQEVFSLSLPAGTYTNDGRMAFNATGTLVAASAGSKFSVHVWDVDRRAESAVLRGHTDLVIDVGFSPDSSWLASASWDHTIRIWNLQTKEPIQVLEGHTDKVIALAISRDGRLLASGSVDGTVRIWDTKTWKEVAAPLKHGSIVYGVSFSPDGTRLACACANNMVRLWDTASFQLVAELDGHAAYVHQVAFSPDGTRLVSGSGDFTVRVWDSLSVRERAQRVAAR